MYPQSFLTPLFPSVSEGLEMVRSVKVSCVRGTFLVIGSSVDESAMEVLRLASYRNC